MNTEPQIEAVTDDDLLLAVTVMQTRLFADGPHKMTGDFGETLRYILGRDRRRVAERRAGRQGDYNPASLSHEAANAELAHISGTISDAREIERLRAEVARLTAACAAKDAALRRWLDYAIGDEPSRLEDDTRCILSTDAGKGWIDATGAVEGKIAQGHLSTRQVWTAKDAIPAEWAGSPVKIIRVP